MGELLRPTEVAKLLGLRRWSIYRAIKRGDIPATRLPNGQLRVAQHDIRQVLAKGRIVPASAITGSEDAA